MPRKLTKPSSPVATPPSTPRVASPAKNHPPGSSLPNFTPINPQPPMSATSGLANAVYLTYTPISTGPASTYEGCFRKLGFKIELSTVKIRDNFKRDLKYHVDDSDLKYLREGDNVQAFKTMTAEFLNQHGLEYWGPSQRGHLQEQDPQKGFLCPRDANRTPSVLVQALQATFNFKAKRCVETKEKGPGWASIRPDYAALTGREGNAAGSNSQDGSDVSEDEKNGIAPNENSDDQQVTWNVFDVRTTPHRLRALSGSGSNSKDRQPANGDGEDEAEVETPSKKPNSAERRVTFVDPQRQAQATRGHAHEKPKQNGKVPAPKVKFEASPRPGYSAPEAPQGIKIPAKRGRKASTTAQSLVVTLPDISSTSDKTDKPKSKRPRANSNASSTADETQDGSDSGGSYLPPPKRRRADSNSSVTRNALETFSLGDHTDDSQDNQPAAANTLKPSLKGPLSAYETDRTFLRVTADNQLDRGPVRVSFPTFNGKTKTEKLFQLLLSERGIHEDLQKRVSALTATFTWSQERVGIRKGRDGDWDYVREVVGKAWRNERRLFEGKGCNIDVMIHVD